MKIIVLEENGFKRQINIQKAVTRIGSSPGSDIQLRSPQVAPFHLQIFYARELPNRARVVNLSEQALTRYSQGEESRLPPHLPVEIGAGDELRIGDVRLVFELPLTAGIVTSSPKISAALILPEPILRPGIPLPGRITLKNEGDQPACQFQVEISGLPEDCYQIDPIPLMYAGAQEEVNIRFFHRGTHPKAGFHAIYLSVAAPASYPGEQVSLQQGIYVSPLLAQGLRILDDMPSARAIPALTDEPPREEAAILPQETPRDFVPERLPLETASLQPEPVRAVPQAASPRPTRPKVVKTTTDSFWDE